MPYRDTDALLTRVAHLEGERARVRARANRLARRRRIRWLKRSALLLLLASVGGFIVLVVTRPFSCCRGSPRNEARWDARTIHPVAEKWRVDHPGECPTLVRLREDKEISAASKITDPWGRVYEIVCDGEEVRVSSAGPDGELRTCDDITVPDPPPPPLPVPSGH